MKETTMSDDLGQIRERQDGFDVRLTTLEQTAETQSTLRASMNQDIADIKIEQRAAHRLLQAAGDTLSDHGRKLTSMDGRLGSLEVLLSNHTQQLFLIHGRLGNVEDRLSDHTRRFISMEGRLGTMEGRLGGVEGELGEVKAGVQTIIAMLQRKGDE
jgi:chromosome segregation ATPase